MTNPVHMATGPQTRWSRVNFAEAMPGVQTPLAWDFWSRGMETALWRIFHGIGVLPDAKVPASADERFSGIFHGRVAANLGTFRHVCDRLPGSSGDIVEEKMFGSRPPHGPSRKPASAHARYPLVAAKLPAAVLRARRELPPLRSDYRAWWQRAVLDRPPTDLAGAQWLFGESEQRFGHALVLHGMPSFLSGDLLEALGRLAEQAGDADLANDLATGFGAMEETELIEDVHRASTGELSIAEVIRRHGNHGPEEGNLASRSWREDPSQLENFVRSFQAAGRTDPRDRERAQAARREDAERRLLAGLPAWRRAGARLIMRVARAYIPLREISKGAFLHAIDGGRCAARSAGAALAESGRVDDVEDVFFLTCDELLAAGDEDLRPRVAQRRADHERYQRHDLPQAWTGAPQAFEPGAEAPADFAELRGIGVGAECVTGAARVVRDPSGMTLADGEILVCPITDPSWTPLFMVAGAVVIDTGSAISHGAIVARELGIPCVINTVTGTRDIPDGARIEVDPREGVVKLV